MSQKCIIYLLFTVFFVTFCTYNSQAKEEKAFKSRGITKSKPKERKKQIRRTKPQVNKFFKLNNQETFRNVKKQNTLAFLIGNDKYTKESDFAPLGQCYNDVILLKQIFTHCVKIDQSNIYSNKDLTLSEFKMRFNEFVKKANANPKANVIITFSGHGNEDGSLVFVNGGMLKPNELKKLVNSFSNDVILIIDACYSGSNEGPKEILKGKKQNFKENSLRVYASLAHLTAKEITYNSLFFKHLKPFYKDILKINKLTGNGYFTAMIGMFFAEYKFKKNENISFKDLVSYVTNRGKQYVEYLAMWGQENKEQRKFASIRLNQQPKILPVQKRVEFHDMNHQFFLIQKYIKPIGLEPSLTGGIIIPMGNLGNYYVDLNLFANVSIAYEMDFITKDFFITGNFSYIGMTSTEAPDRRLVELSILVSSAGIKYYPVKKSFFSFSTGIEAGLATSFLRASSFGPVKEEARTLNNLYLSGGASLNFEVYQGLDIVVPAKFVYINYGEDPLIGMSYSLGVNYYF